MSETDIFIAPIHGIAVDENLGRGDKLDNLLHVTNDHKTIEKLVSAQFIRAFGTVERDALFTAGLVAYARLNGDQCQHSPDEALSFLSWQLTRLHEIARFLWMVKDNAIKIEDAFYLGNHFASTRIVPFITSLADGRDEIISFNRQELKNVRRMFRHLVVENEKSLSDRVAEGRSGEVIEQSVSPFTRAMFFAGVARQSYYLSVKIANYCSALESLLVSSPVELTYRLSQRVAWLLGTNIEERIALSRQLKAAYDIRSTAVHGTSLSQKRLKNELMPAVLACDDILRRVLEKVLDDDVVRKYVWGLGVKSDEFEERMRAITLGHTMQEDRIE